LASSTSCARKAPGEVSEVTGEALVLIG
jgi:hypothetical protein